MWRGGQDQKIRQANPMSNTKDKNEPSDAEAVTLPRLVVQHFSTEELLTRSDEDYHPDPDTGEYRLQPVHR